VIGLYEDGDEDCNNHLLDHETGLHDLDSATGAGTCRPLFVKPRTSPSLEFYRKASLPPQLRRLKTQAL